MPNEGLDRVINEIVDKHYLRFLTDMGNQQPAANGRMYSKSSKSVVEIGNSTKLLGYDCQHDRVQKRGMVPQELIDRMAAKQELEAQQGKHGALNNNNTMAKMQISDSGEDVHQIRILFDKTYITGTNDDYACYQVNKQIPTGDDTAVNQCTDADVYDPCIRTCDSLDIQSAGLQQVIIKYVLPTIQETLSRIIMVPTQTPDTLFFNKDIYEYLGGECDYGVEVPKSHTTTGIDNVDFVVYVTARPTPFESTIAYALACNYDISGSRLGRPKGATINFNPRYFAPFINNPSGFLFNEYVRVGIHEMTHALGFSPNFYSSYLGPNGKTYPGGASRFITKTGTTPSGSKYSYQRAAITSPTVSNFVQNHYNCSTIKYAELEDAGASGTAGSHWEKRTAGEEYMVGYVSPISPITNLTLSLLQDTGWYTIDFSNAEPLVWGKNLGCAWLDQCTPNSWNYQGYFCDSGSAVPTCTPTRMGKGICTTAIYKGQLAKQYQHFKDQSVGGTDYVSDYCPYSQVYENSDLTKYCVDASKQSTATAGISEVYSTNSRCFEYDNKGKVDMACWEQRCNSNNKVEVNLAGTWVTCDEDGAKMKANGITLICPFGYAACGGSPTQVSLNSSARILVQSSLMMLFITSILFLL
eukprot:gene11373-13258_t